QVRARGGEAVKPALALALAASLVAVSARPAFARPAFAQDPAPQESSEGEASKSKSEDAKESKEEHWLAVVGGEVHTGTGAVLRGATVLAKNGKIEKIGYDLDVPPDAKTIDAKGMLVYPGIVAMSTQGIVGTAGSDFEDTIDPFGQRLILGLSS